MTSHVIDGALRTGGSAITDDSKGTVQAITGLSGVEQVNGSLHTVVLTFAAASFTITDALAYLGTKIYALPEGRIMFLGSTASLQFAVTSDRSTTINDSASLTWALGTVAASNITLSSTMVDLLPKTTKVLAAATTALNTASTGALATTPAHFDGTGTSKDMYLNFGFETNTDIDADGTMTVTGTIKLVYINLGDY
jgi:hypothetical protein